MRLNYSKTSLLLSIAGSAGVIITSVLSSIATPKAIQAVKDNSRRNHNGDPNAYTIPEAIRSGWRYYIFAGISGLVTIGCIVGSEMLGVKQQKAIAGAYMALLSMHKNYENKVIEKFGRDTHEEIMRELTIEKARNVDITAWGLMSNSCIAFDGANEEPRLFYDSISERYFESTFSKVLEAEYHLNRNYCLGAILTLNDFYDFLGIERTKYGDTVGWTINDDGIYWIDFNHYHAEVDDGHDNVLDCWVIESVFSPTTDIQDELCGTTLLF